MFSFALIFIISFALIIGGWVGWKNDLNVATFFNSILLLIGVGFAEELIFRGWLWGEFNRFIGFRWSGFIQAILFSLAHIRFDIGFFSMLSLLIGLFLLGMVLNFRRILDHGSIWGCVGLHGGLVGFWFLFTQSFYKLSEDAPAPSWLMGSLSEGGNPLAGFFSILILLSLLIYQFKAVAIAPKPLRGARSEFSNGAIP